MDLHDCDGRNGRPRSSGISGHVGAECAPTFGLQVSLGKTNTVALCPGLTNHSELSDAALREAGITPTIIRIAVDERAPLIHQPLNTRRRCVTGEKVDEVRTEGTLAHV